MIRSIILGLHADLFVKPKMDQPKYSTEGFVDLQSHHHTQCA